MKDEQTTSDDIPSISYGKRKTLRLLSRSQAWV
jgi:hypothetical protein